MEEIIRAFMPIIGVCAPFGRDAGRGLTGDRDGGLLQSCAHLRPVAAVDLDADVESLVIKIGGMGKEARLRPPDLSG